ncbi:ArsR family transcriptional regulator [Methanocella sp. CWC-04]|uniref:ArsR family transcriptional regulator n=1 Tax=Methanooceanicella nereidis TaxID=2052831 RepID=A0AAP2W740_9EURY|nr:ArsR family transcriptional regulator [Methanocella sp. CWC-04]MCD1294716.1 ArsR family transcriptional regulator [Methanocella sp. CWC-04]
MVQNIKRTKIINDPSDLVPLLQVFNSKLHSQVFDELSAGWKTEEELREITGKDVIKSLDALRQGGLIENRWRMPEPGASPVMEYRTSYSEVRTNFQCTMKELSDIIMIAFSMDESLRKLSEEMEVEVLKGNASLLNLVRTFDKSPMFLKAVAKRSNRIVVKGQRFEVIKDK